MNLTEILLLIAIILIIFQILISFLKNTNQKDNVIKREINALNIEINKIDSLVRSEFSNNRLELQNNAKETRQELSASLRSFAEQLIDNINDLARYHKQQLDDFANTLQLLSKRNEELLEKLVQSNEKKQTDFQLKFEQQTSLSNQVIATSLKSNTEKTEKLTQTFTENAKELQVQLNITSKESRQEQIVALKSFEDKFGNNVREFNELQRQKFNDLAIKQEQIKQNTETKLDAIKATVESKMNQLQESNVKKLDEMRQTVDEKLQSTLERRLNDSFKVISERLELVHKGLGEMQVLANSVSDIKKVMTNVKSRGIIGEYQLANLLEDLLTNEQYEKNVKTKQGSGAIVEFAIKMPNHNKHAKSLWLPIDSKFPKEDYEALVDAYDEGDPVKLENLRKSFKSSIIKNAKDIKEKYIDPPNTTEYGIMFLPFESLYAEVLRTPGLFELLQNEFKITITGPTTLSALLNSLQMGFRTLAIEQRSGEVWDILSVVKTEFGKFGTALEKTKKKLQEATNTIDHVGVRSRQIERKLKDVQELPGALSNEIEHANHEDAS